MSLLNEETGLSDPSIPRPAQDTNSPQLQRPRTISPEVIQQILQLNQAGHLATAISKQLGISRSTIARALDYLAQDPNNGVIDYTTQQKEFDRQVLILNKQDIKSTTIAKRLGTNKKRVLSRLKFLIKDPNNGVIDNSKEPKEERKWYVIINHIRDVLLPYYEGKGIKPSLRTVFYRLETTGYIDKTDNTYKLLVQHTVQARIGEEDSQGELRYPKLPIDCFADETREMLDHFSNYEPTDPEDAQDPQEYIKEKIQGLINAPNNWDYEGSDGEAGGHWYNQPEYVEVWIEKFALAPTFEKFLEDRYVNIVVNKGYASLSFLWKNCERLKEKIEEYGADNVHVLYFGDFDPSGEDMDRNTRDYFEKFDLPPEIFERIAITPEQITEYNIPARPVKTKPRQGKKRIDPRTISFKARHGDLAADLDAFLAANDEAFEELVQKAVDDHYRQDIYEEMLEDYERKPDSYFTDEQRGKAIGNMIDTITEAFKPDWDKEHYEDVE
jgi:hypothetical protein